MTATIDEVERLDAALGATPPVIRCEAAVYPGSVPFFAAPEAETPRPVPNHEALRLYVHLPFCNYHCSFCHFATVVSEERGRQERYLAALERELEWIEPGTRLSQFFVGGGTPTALPPDLLDRALGAIHDRVVFVEDIVHTVEVSPDSVTRGHLDVLRDRGVGRISMGIQSLDDRVLDAVSRRHTERQVLDACALIVANGFILNVDLMYGLPSQDHESFARDLATVMSRDVASLTLYAVRVRELSALGRSIEEAKRLDLANLLAWRRFVHGLADEHGLTQVRAHTFKRLDDFTARHRREPCVDVERGGYQFGAGMSARSHLNHMAFRNTKNFDEYCERLEQGRSPVAGVIPLGPGDRQAQFVGRTLGECEPLPRAVYRRAFGTAIDDDHGDALRRLTEGGLLDDDGETLRMTESGRLLYDRVLVNFFPPHAHDWLWAHA